MTRVTALAATSLAGLILMMLSQGDASNAVTFGLYGVGALLFAGSVGLFCLAARPARSGKIDAETALFTLMMASLLAMLTAMWTGLQEGQALELLKFLPVFLYFCLLSLTASTLAGVRGSRAAVVWKVPQLMLFPFFAASLERDRIRVSAGRLAPDDAAGL